FAERAWALSALADAGKFNPGYAAELARRAQFLDLEGVSEVALALARQGDTQSSTVEGLVGRLWDGIVIRLYESKEQYGGLQQRAPDAGPRPRGAARSPGRQRGRGRRGGARAREGRRRPRRARGDDLGARGRRQPGGRARERLRGESRVAAREEGRGRAARAR